MSGRPAHNTQPHARLPTSFLGMEAWMTSQLNVELIRKPRGVLMCLAYFFDMLSMGVCKTRHWQTSGRLVQELNTCTVVDKYSSNLGHAHTSVKSYPLHFRTVLACRVISDRMLLSLSSVHKLSCHISPCAVVSIFCITMARSSSQ